MVQLDDVWVMYGPVEWGTGQWGDVWSSGMMYGPVGGVLASGGDAWSSWVMHG